MFVDTGLAVLLALLGREDPAEIDAKAWNRALDSLEAWYVEGVLRHRTTLLFTQNAFDNNAWRQRPERRREALRAAFELARRPGEREVSCVFFPSYPAVDRVGRDRVPLLQGRKQLNFVPDGQGGVPISAQALGCLLAMPLGVMLVDGGALFLQTYDTWVRRALITAWVEEVRREIALLRLGGRPLYRMFAGVRLMEAFYTLEEPGLEVPGGLEGWVIQNMGHRVGARRIVLEPGILRFLRWMKVPGYVHAYQELVHRGWIRRGREEEVQRMDNRFYRILLRGRRGALHFVRYLLEYLRQGGEAPCWPLVEIYQQTVRPMTKQHLEVVARVGDALARHIATHEHLRLYRRLMGLEGSRDSLPAFRQLLLHQARRMLQEEGTLLLTMEELLLLFPPEGGDGLLMRDLLRLRVLEHLYHLGFRPETSIEETKNPTD